MSGLSERDDVETLALVIGSANPRTRHVYIDGNDGCHAAARAVLNSEWLAAIRDEAKAEALAPIRALAEEFDSEIDWSNGRSNYGDNAAWESAARRLRALLDGGDQS